MAEATKFARLGSSTIRLVRIITGERCVPEDVLIDCEVFFEGARFVSVIIPTIPIRRASILIDNIFWSRRSIVNRVLNVKRTNHL